MKLKLRSLSLLVAVLALLLVPVAALAQPVVPLQYEGNVTIGVSPAPVGTIISAEVDDIEVATNDPDGIDEEGYYRLDVSASEGDVVVLKVNGVVGGEAAYPSPMSTWHVVCNLAIETGILALAADAGGPYSGTVSQSVSLSGSATGGTSPYSYAWDLDNDGAYDDSAAQNPSYTWDAAGDYTVGLQVTDDAADTATDTATVTVTAAPEEVVESFSGTLTKEERETLLVIPSGATELNITLEATADIDLELYDGDTFVIGWKAIISSSGSTTGTYQEDTFAYSGWYGGDESITADGPLSRAYTLKVYGFRAGDYTVTVSYVPAGPLNPPPEIDIVVPATVALESPVIVTVSATDDDDVRMVMFMVSSPYSEEWSSNSNSEYENLIELVMSFDDEASLTFTPGWAGTYTVEAWAYDLLGNGTPEANPETTTFVVSE